MRKSRYRSSSQTNIAQLDREHRSTIGALKRSSSYSNLTPARRTTAAPTAPLSAARGSSAVRSTSATRPSAPASISRQTIGPNIDGSRKAIAEKANRIIDILHQYENEFEPRLNLPNGLKSMTAKQFVDIIQCFRHKISGKNVPSTERQVNPEIELIAFIQKLSYPTTIAKSWFKTPTAPHAYSDCINLLAWLSEYIQDQMPDENDIAGDDEFPNVDYTRQFSIEVEHAFPLWNKSDDDECATITQQLIDANIAIQLKHHVENGNELIRFTEELRRSSERIQREHATEISAPIVNNNNYDTKLTETSEQLKLAQNQRLLAIEQYEEIRQKHSQLTSKYSLRSTKFSKLQQQIQNQRYSLLDLKQQFARESTAKETINMLTNDLIAARHIDGSQQIAIARAKAQFNEAIIKFSGLLLNCERLIARISQNTPLDVELPRLIPSQLFDSIAPAISGLDQIDEVIDRYCRQFQEKHNQQDIEQHRLAAESKYLKENVNKQKKS